MSKIVKKKKIEKLFIYSFIYSILFCTRFFFCLLGDILDVSLYGNPFVLQII